MKRSRNDDCSRVIHRIRATDEGKDKNVYPADACVTTETCATLLGLFRRNRFDAQAHFYCIFSDIPFFVFSY